MIIRSKKAQFYLIGALLLVIYAFSIFPGPKLTEDAETSFSILHQNFMSELPVVVNRAVLLDDNATAAVIAFADAFSDYANTKDPAFGFAYVFKDGNEVVVGNELDKSINATVGSTASTIAAGSRLHASSNDVTLIVAELSYTFTFTDDKEAKVVFRKEEGDEVQVHVEE